MLFDSSSSLGKKCQISLTLENRAFDRDAGDPGCRILLESPKACDVALSHCLTDVLDSIFFNWIEMNFEKTLNFNVHRKACA